MNADDEVQILRRRIGELEESLDALRTTTVAGNPTKLVQTITVGTYPTSAQAFYAVKAVRPGGDQNEGAMVTTSVVSPTFYAANVGGTVPPNGTILLATLVGSRWVVQYG